MWLVAVRIVHGAVVKVWRPGEALLVSYLDHFIQVVHIGIRRVVFGESKPILGASMLMEVLSCGSLALVLYNMHAGLVKSTDSWPNRALSLVRLLNA